MTVKITPQSDNFLLIGENKGLLLRVSCAERLTQYNRDRKLLDLDLQLYRGFTAAQDITSLHPIIDKLAGHYGLRAGAPILRDARIAPTLAQYLTEIRSLPDADINSIGAISQQFYKLRELFSKALERNKPFPEVSLSKLLHFVHPGSFWLLDSRVENILDIWGYPTNGYPTKFAFGGFGKLLEDLFRDPEFESFRTFLIQKDGELVSSLSNPFLKLLDKLLWPNWSFVKS